MKQFLLIASTIVLAVGAFYFYYKFEAEPEQRVDTQDLETVKPSGLEIIVNNNKALNQKKEFHLNVYEENDFKINPTRFLTRCGFEEDFYWDTSSKESQEILKQMTERQYEAYEHLQASDMCDSWYKYLSTVDAKEIIALKTMKNENRLLLKEFDNLAENEKTTIAKNVIKNDDMRLKKRVALYHLLKNDVDFIRQVAENIGTENISYVSQAAAPASIVFECQTDSASCSVNSGRMLTHCLVNEDHCGLDYYEFLQETRSQNEVNDIFNITDAVRRILGI